MQMKDEAIHRLADDLRKHAGLAPYLQDKDRRPKILSASHPVRFDAFSDATPVWAPETSIVVTTLAPLDLVWPEVVTEHAVLCVLHPLTAGAHMLAAPASYHSSRRTLRVGPLFELVVRAGAPADVTEAPAASAGLEIRLPDREALDAWSLGVLTRQFETPDRVKAGHKYVRGALTHVERMLWFLTKAMQAKERADRAGES